MATKEEIRTQNKIKMLFEKVVEPNYVFNSYYADTLLTKLSNCKDPEISFLESMPLVSDLLVDALNRTVNAENTVKVFLMRVFAVMSKRELHFAKMFAKKGDDIAQGFRTMNTDTMTTSLKVAYMEVALAIVFHNSGIAWLLETGVWKEILSLCNERRTVFIVRQTYKFAARFLWKLNDLGDEEHIKEVIIGHIMKPISDIDFINIRSMTSEEEEKIAKVVEPMLQILLSIMSEPNRIQKSTLLVSILLKDFKITSHFYVIFDRTRREDLTLLTTRLIFLLVIAKTFLYKPLEPGVVYKKEDFFDLGIMYFNTIQALIQRRSATLVLDFCNAANMIWSNMLKENEDIQNDCPCHIKLQNQLLFICLVPCLVYVKKVGNLSLMTYERLDQYIIKLLNNSCEHTARAAYALRDLSLELDTLAVTLQSVKRLTCMKSHLNNGQANLVFQALFYVLKEFEPVNDEGEMKTEETYDESEEKVMVMTYVLDVVLCLVKNHNINWHESLEVLCLYSVIYNILQRPNLSCKFVVTALNLIAVTIKKFLPPNLTLLLETKPGSSMHELGELVYKKLHDRNWEVRDSALELLYVCTELSLIKFPPFQKQILENNLINVSTAIALNDHEFYVQVSALKCLGASSKVPSLWERLKFQYPNVEEQLISMLRFNQEGIVRKEACNVLYEIYQNQKLTPTFKNELYQHMVSSALSDFHWEVQMSALKFWKHAICTHFSDQGMLDGTFPPVTFSRQTRKIVNLNETEIKRRLQSILDELASIGCLTVLVKLLHEENEIDIMESAMNIALQLLEILDKYKVPDVIKPNDNEPNSVEELMYYIKEEGNDLMEEELIVPDSNLDADNVIEGILNSNDINLLANIYESHMSLQNKSSDKPIVPKVLLLKRASPYLFVNFLKSKDFKAMVEEKRKWKDGIKSISSLLDDVLGIYDINDEINTLDCY